MATRSLNKVQLIGHLGGDPETRYTQSGSALTNFRIATNRSWTDQATSQRRERTDWHNVVCWGRLAEVASQYLHKGSHVYVEGELQTRSFDREGQTHYRTEVNCRELIMLGRDATQAGPGSTQYDRPAPTGGARAQTGGNRQDAQPQSQFNRGGTQPADAEAAPKLDDDLPF